MSFPLTNDPTQKITQVDPKEETVMMVFPGPADVRLVQQDNSVLIFKPGVRKVPVRLKDHPWLKAHKVVLATEAAEANPPRVETTGISSAVVPENQQPGAQENKPPATTTAPPAGAVEAFGAMTKAELAVFAKKNLSLDLDPSKMNKDAMVTAVLEAQQKKEAASAAGEGK